MDEPPLKTGKFKALCASVNSAAGFFATVLGAVVSIILILSYWDRETPEPEILAPKVSPPLPPASEQPGTPRIDHDTAALEAVISAGFAQAGARCRIDDLLLKMESAAVTPSGNLTGYVWDYALTAAIGGVPVGLNGQVNALAKTETGARRDAMDRIALRFFELPEVIGECGEPAH